MNDIRPPRPKKLPPESPTRFSRLKNFYRRSSPLLRKLARRVPQKKNLRFVLLGAVLAAIILVIAVRFMPGVKDFIAPSQKVETPLKQSQGVLTKQDPPFATKTPNGEAYTGRWTRVSPPERNPVYAFNGEIDGIGVIVSEQPLPKELRNDTTASTQALAAGYSATQKLNVAGAAAYLGTSAKGPQSVIMTKGDTLILIKSTARIPNSAWEEYLKNLN